MASLNEAPDLTGQGAQFQVAPGPEGQSLSWPLNMPKNVPAQNRGRDSGYSSLANTPDCTESGQKFKHYSKPIPKSSSERFYDLTKMFNAPLTSLLRSKHLQYTVLEMSLKVLGRDEASAKPCILILCDKSISPAVKQFFGQKWVKEELRPDDTMGFPRFDHYVKSLPPWPAAISAYASIVEQLWATPGTEPLCGKEIMAKGSHGSFQATIGGVIKVTWRYTEPVLYAMTAGHIIVPWMHSSRNPAQDLEEQGNWSCSGDEMAEHEFADLENEIELEIDSRYYDASENLSAAHFTENRADTREGPREVDHNYDSILDSVPNHEIGRGFTLARSAGATPNLDYALIAFLDTSRYRPNIVRLPVRGRGIFPVEDTEIHHKELIGPCGGDSRGGLGKQVVLLSGMFGFRFGTLSRMMSSLLIPPGKSFIETYKLELAGGRGVEPGDCGSWVVDESTCEVYGQVIAGDIFREAHVVPLPTVLRDIEMSLDAESAYLPTAAEVEAWTKDYSLRPVPLDPTMPTGANNFAPSPSTPDGTMRFYENLSSNSMYMPFPLRTSKTVVPSSRPTDSGYSSMNTSPNVHH